MVLNVASVPDALRSHGVASEQGGSPAAIAMRIQLRLST